MTHPAHAKKRRPRWGRILGVLAALAVALAAALLLPRLSGDRLPTEDSSSPAESDAPAAGDLPAAARPTQPLHMVLSDTRERFCAGTQDGFYEVGNPLLLANAQSLLYTDYASGSRIFLCASPNCTHDSAVCPSYLPGGTGGTTVFALYNHLFIVTYGTTEPDKAGARLEMRDLNGGNARALCRFAAGESLYPTMAADDRYLYYVKTKATRNDEKDDVELVTTLERVALSDGQVTVLREMQATEYFVGVEGQHLLIKSLVNGDIHLDAVTIDGQAAADFSTVTWPRDDRVEYITDDGQMFYVTQVPCQVKVYDFQTGETRTLVEDFPAADWYTVKFGAYHRPTLLLTTTEETTENERIMRDYAVNTVEGGYQEIALPRVNERGTHMNATLRAFTEDTVLLETGSEARTWQIETEKGNGAETFYFPTYALLSWQDYLASRQDCRAVADSTLPDDPLA